MVWEPCLQGRRTSVKAAAGEEGAPTAPTDTPAGPSRAGVPARCPRMPSCSCWMDRTSRPPGRGQTAWTQASWSLFSIALRT